MKLQLLSIRRVTTTSPEIFCVKVGANNETPDGHADAEFEVVIENLDFMNITLQQIESAAIERVKFVISK
jgi:hypothetical protein